ncbi:hypothetical protein LAZ67_20001695 [Cordylochernes scorpioides]|uniref:Uncharacterized protein n=1 Tax=Cordylochernes scorpioides TaxID=51811 RepID=A0ABY6LL58_9ARAC|nr:hypothetical protein LAZ67_20001695 [Cordylochernes scorpioides]
MVCRSDLDRALESFEAQGRLQSLYQKWWKDRSECPDAKRRAFVSQDKDLHDGMIPIEVADMQVDLTTTKESTKNRSNSDVSDANSIVKNGRYINPGAAKSEKWAEQVEAAEKDNNTESFQSVHGKKKETV